MLETRSTNELNDEVHHLDKQIEKKRLARAKLDAELAKLEGRFDLVSRILYNKQQREVGYGTYA